MKFLIDKQKLDELLINFYTLTGIRLVIFDSDFVKVAAYPESDCEFCKAIRKTEKGKEAHEADRQCGSASKGIPGSTETRLTPWIPGLDVENLQ